METHATVLWGKKNPNDDVYFCLSVYLAVFQILDNCFFCKLWDIYDHTVFLHLSSLTCV